LRVKNKVNVAKHENSKWRSPDLFNQEIQVGDLETEFSNFANNWDNIRNALDTDTKKQPTSEETTAQPQTKKKCCKSCCAYVLIFKYNLFCTAYTNVALMYEFVLTLSIRQVQCERSFSTLKFIKNRLRSMPPDENLPYCIQLIQKK
jgi:hypothetical protein